MKCALCGFEFEKKETVMGCNKCPMMKNCKLNKCPNCGYEWPDEPKWLKIFKKEEKKNDNS